jgi:hypothetical protein
MAEACQVGTKAGSLWKRWSSSSKGSAKIRGCQSTPWLLGPACRSRRSATLRKESAARALKRSSSTRKESVLGSKKFWRERGRLDERKISPSDDGKSFGTDMNARTEGQFRSEPLQKILPCGAVHSNPDLPIVDEEAERRKLASCSSRIRRRRVSRCLQSTTF